MNTNPDPHCRISNIRYKMPGSSTIETAPLRREPWAPAQDAPVKQPTSSWWDTHEHYDRNGYCDNPARGY